MTDRIAELRALHELATDGDWHAPGLGEVHDEEHRILALCIDCEPVEPGEAPFPSLEHGERLAAFIVAAANAMPALLDCAEAMREYLLWLGTDIPDDARGFVEQMQGALARLNGADHD